MASVILPRICRQCGKQFPGGPRAWYCTECRTMKRKEAAAKYRKKGCIPDRALGSIDQCCICGKDYVVNSARQKYCPDCAYEAVRAVDRQASKAWNQAHKSTYSPARNAKRNAQRKEDPERIRAKEREYKKRKRQRNDPHPD